MDYDYRDLIVALGLVTILVGFVVLLVALLVHEGSCRDGVLPSHESNCYHVDHEMVLPKRGDPAVVLCRCREGE